MDTIRFDILPAPDVAHPDEDVYTYPSIRIVVNGRDLLDLVREVELPFAAAQGSPGIAGGYVGLEPEILGTQHFLGGAEGLYRGPILERNSAPNRVAMMICDCGEPGCWPFTAAISVENDRITWSDFRQPHRPGWKYDALGPFTFSRQEYEAALRQMADSLHGPR